MRLLLVDDHELVRESIAIVLRNVPGTSVVTARDVASALAVLRDDRAFDIILLDYRMPGMAFLSGLVMVRKLAPSIPVALLSGDMPQTAISDALAQGAAGYLPKSLSTRALVAALRVMVSGTVFKPLSVQGELNLTLREAQVLSGLSRSQSNKAIARDLELQEVTVKLHVKTLFRKLGARNRTHAVLLAMEQGLA